MKQTLFLQTWTLRLSLIVASIVAPVWAAPSDYTWITLAGRREPFATFDGSGANARIDHPTGVAVDVAGNAYVSQVNDHVIRKISPAGEVTTLAGMANQPGSADGKGAIARFNVPMGVAMDRNGCLYVQTTQITRSAKSVRRRSDHGCRRSGSGRLRRWAWQYGHVVGPDRGGDRWDRKCVVIRRMELRPAQTDDSGPGRHRRRSAGYPGSTDGQGIRRCSVGQRM